jgi:diguanylate cyclase (GGDEF)-like protein
MAGDVQPLASAATQPPPAATALLRAVGELWGASDRDGVATAARNLVAKLAPGAAVHRLRRATAEMVADRYRLIGLAEDEALLIAAEPANCEERVLLDAGLELVAERASALSQQLALTASIEETARAERLQRAQYAIADQASAVNPDVTAMFSSLHGIVGSLMYAENFFVALYDAQHDHVRFPYYADRIAQQAFEPGRDVPMAEIMYGPTWYVIREGKPLMGSVDTIRRQVGGPFHGSGPVSEDWLGVPLLQGSNATGCVVVQSYDQAHHYDEQDKALLIYVAQHIQTALERRLAHAQLEHRVAERTEALRDANRVLQRQVLERQRGERLQAALFRIAELASTTDSIEGFYAAVHRIVGGLLYARNFYIAVLSEDGTELAFPYSADERDRIRAPRKLTNGLTEYVLRHGTALLVNAAEIARLRAEGKVTKLGADAVCWLGVPLVGAEQAQGVLVVQTYSPEHYYTPRDQELLTFVSYQIASALERVRATESLHRAYAELEHRVGERTRALALANRDLRAQIAERERIEARLKYDTLHDSLTGLPNRGLLMQRMASALAGYRVDRGRGFAVLFMDLDRFKVINDSVGHLVGDDLLFQAGNRIRSCLKSGDMVARLGGDEFGVLLEDIDAAAQACRIAERIIGDFNAPFRLAGKELFTSVSIGITLGTAHYRRPEELLRDADSAMYRAKADGRRRYAVFDEGLRQQAIALLEVGNDLRRSVSRREFVPYYQPIVDTDQRKVAGYEALMRWLHPRRGVLLPSEFLSVAEDGGIAEAIDWQIFETVCGDANALAGSHDAFVGINLSAQHFRDAELSRRLLDLLASRAVATARFRVEVTERALLENTPLVRRALQTLRGAGTGIALDDFGTGFSSLSYLHQYPLETLKIDQSFIASLTQDSQGSSVAVIRAILAMADALSMQVIAEGVETTAQHDLLRRLGCRYMQGFLYAEARPLKAWTSGDAPHFPR